MSSFDDRVSDLYDEIDGLKNEKAVLLEALEELLSSPEIKNSAHTDSCTSCAVGRARAAIKAAKGNA